MGKTVLRNVLHERLPRQLHPTEGPALSLLAVPRETFRSRGAPRAVNPPLAPRHRGRHREGNAYAKRHRTEHGILPPCQRLVPTDIRPAINVPPIVSPSSQRPNWPRMLIV